MKAMSPVRWVLSILIILSLAVFAAQDIRADRVLVEKGARRMTRQDPCKGRSGGGMLMMIASPIERMTCEE